MKTDLGGWVRYSIVCVQIVMEVFIDGIRINPNRAVRLSNVPIPPQGECNKSELKEANLREPSNPYVFEVRLARRSEYSEL